MTPLETLIEQRKTKTLAHIANELQTATSQVSRWLKPGGVKIGHLWGEKIIRTYTNSPQTKT